MANNIGNPMWIAGKSGNPGGRPKGTKRNWKKELEHFIRRNGSHRELERLYRRLDTEKEQSEMLKWIFSYVVAKPQAATMSEQEIEAFHDRAQKLESENAELKSKLSKYVQAQTKAS